MGIVSCLGTDLAEVTDALYNCNPGITYCDEFAEVGMKSQVSGHPTFDWCAQKPSRSFRTLSKSLSLALSLSLSPATRSDALIDRKKIRFMGQNAKYAYVAMANAIEDAGLKPEDYESNPRVGGILGQADTSAENIDEVCKAVEGGKRSARRSARTASRARCRLRSLPSSPPSSRCREPPTRSARRARRPRTASAPACSRSSSAFRTSSSAARASRAAGAPPGCSTRWARSRRSTMTRRRPPRARSTRSATASSSARAAASSVLESLEHAKARGAKIYGELTGYAATGDGYDMVAPSGEGGGRAMKMAMEMADKIGA